VAAELGTRIATSRPGGDSWLHGRSRSQSGLRCSPARRQSFCTWARSIYRWVPAVPTRASGPREHCADEREQAEHPDRCRIITLHAPAHHAQTREQRQRQCRDVRQRHIDMGEPVQSTTSQDRVDRGSGHSDASGDLDRAETFPSVSGQSSSPGAAASCSDVYADAKTDRPFLLRRVRRTDVPIWLPSARRRGSSPPLQRSSTPRR